MVLCIFFWRIFFRKENSNQDGNYNYVLRIEFDINQFNYTSITYEQFLENREYIKYLHGKLNTYTPDLDNKYLIETFKKLKIK